MPMGLPVLLEFDEEQAETVAIVAGERPGEEVLRRVGEVAHAAVADVLEKRGFVEEPQDERGVIHGEPAEHEAVGVDYHHGIGPPFVGL